MPDTPIDPEHPVVQELKAVDTKQQKQLDSNSQKLGGWGMLTTPQGVTAIVAAALSAYGAYRTATSGAAPPPPIQVEVTFPKGFGGEPVAPPTKQEVK